MLECVPQDNQSVKVQINTYVKNDVGIAGMEFSISFLGLSHHLEFLENNTANTLPISIGDVLLE